MKQKRNRNIGTVDRISGFPESIIHGIMSHLSSKEVAQTCVLSKRWYNVKMNYPVLGFDLPCANVEENADYLSKIKQPIYDSLNYFSSNKLVLQTFSLNKVVLGQPNLSSDLDRWIELALAIGVKELNLCFEQPNMFKVEPEPDIFYILPPPVFSSKTLTSLELTSCVLDMPISIFSSLRKLALTECILKGSVSLKDTDCHLLEEISIQHCRGENFNSIYIPSLLRLHTVVVGACSFLEDDFIIVEILSQRIQCLALSLHEYLRPLSDFNIYGCARLKSLYLSSATITDAELHSLLSKFPLLEELYLFNCSRLEMIKISSPLLRILEICSDLHQFSVYHIEVSAQNLEIFIYKSFMFEKAFGKSLIKVVNCCRSLKTVVLYGHETVIG